MRIGRSVAPIRSAAAYIAPAARGQNRFAAAATGKNEKTIFRPDVLIEQNRLRTTSAAISIAAYAIRCTDSFLLFIINYLP